MHLAAADTTAVTLVAECVLISVTTLHYTTLHYITLRYNNMFSSVCICTAAPYFKSDELGKDSCFIYV